MAAWDRSTGRCKPASLPIEDRIDALCVVSRVCEGSRAAASLVGAVQRLGS
jgi:hypothetical protein